MAPKTGVSSNKKSLPAWFWMLFGSGLTLGALLFVYLLNPFERSETPVSQQATDSAQTMDDAEPTPQDLEFYDVLPEQSVQLIAEPDLSPEPETSTEAATTEPDSLPSLDTAESSAASIESPNQYRLNLGSFQSAADADRRRAQVLMMGLDDANIVINQTPSGTTYTLMSSAYDSRAKAANAQSRLRDSGFESVILTEAKPEAASIPASEIEASSSE